MSKKVYVKIGKDMIRVEKKGYNNLIKEIKEFKKNKRKLKL